MKLIHVLLFAFLSGMNLPVSAQGEKSTTVLITPAPQEDWSKLSDSSASKLRRIQQSGTYKQLLLVRAGNLAKIQKEGILTFTIPGSGESATYKAKKVVAISEPDFTWYGESTNGDALFICKNERLSGSFRVNRRSFELYPIEGEDEFSVLTESPTDRELECGR